MTGFPERSGEADMHLKDILFAVANFLILFGALLFIMRKMIARTFRQRKEKIAAELKRRGVGQTGGERHAV